jgi:hypothetical protein
LVPAAEQTRAPHWSALTLRVPEEPQSLKGRVPLERARRASVDGSKAHDETPVTGQNDLVPGLRPSHKIGQARFRFAAELFVAVAAPETLVRTLVQIKPIGWDPAFVPCAGSSAEVWRRSLTGQRLERLLGAQRRLGIGAETAQGHGVFACFLASEGD